MEETQAVVVNPQRDGKIIAQIKSKSLVSTINSVIASEIIDERMKDIESVLSGNDLVDPTMKNCSKCKKTGRPSLHPVGDFSKLLNGKLSSQCKKCKADAATAWCKKRADHRAAYHKNYRDERKNRSNAVAILQGTHEPVKVTEIDEAHPFKGRKGLESLYAAYSASNTSLVMESE